MLEIFLTLENRKIPFTRTFALARGCAGLSAAARGVPSRGTHTDALCSVGATSQMAAPRDLSLSTTFRGSTTFKHPLFYLDHIDGSSESKGASSYLHNHSRGYERLNPILLQKESFWQWSLLSQQELLWPLE